MNIEYIKNKYKIQVLIKNTIPKKEGISAVTLALPEAKYPPIPMMMYIIENTL